MVIVTEQAGTGSRQLSLWEALALPETFPAVISLVGAGGKTSTMRQLAREMESRGKRAIITTSTHIQPPEEWEGYQVVLADTHEVVKETVWKGGILVVGQLVQGKAHKLKGLPVNQIGRLTEYADVVLVEADGARRQPLKVPEEHEPVLIPETDVVIGCAGLDSIGKPLQETCFRKELAARLLGVEEDHLLTAHDIAVILTHERGTRKSVGKTPYRMVLNKADDSQREAYGREVLEEIRRMQTEPVILTSFFRET